jgi:hypothetical protein
MNGNAHGSGACQELVATFRITRNARFEPPAALRGA